MQNNFTLAVTEEIKHLLFIDSQVEDYQHLAAGRVPGIETIILDFTKDGVEQIAEALQARNNIVAVHIVSHGSPGCLYLGNTRLSLETITRYTVNIQSWFSSLSHSLTPSLLLYGCNVAAGDAGAEFIEKLHAITGAAIAASTNFTGNKELGGDWELEYQIGSVSISEIFEPQVQQNWQGILATVNANFTTLNFGTATLESGTDKLTNAVYRYTNIITTGGVTVDARVTITAIQNATINTTDGTTNAARFEPTISSNSASGGYVDYKFEFVPPVNYLLIKQLEQKTKVAATDH